ncbi:MAG: Cache 3/Cache 2 fusion domain-containing protein [Candidatus Sungbacteria bacterium]|nr:Cache 3/Cache 2 fusion domain-containing protein [Candidatus Sungbacteria bacterium]
MAIPSPLRSLRASEAYLTASVIGIGLALLGLYAFLSFSNYQSIVAKELESHTAILERAAVELDGFVNTRFLLLEELASSVAIDFSDPVSREEKASLFLHRYPEFQKIRILNAAGKDLTVSSRLVTFGKQDLKEAVGEDAFENARAGRSHVGRARVSFGAIPATQLAIPIMDEIDIVIGVMMADLDLRKIWDAVSQIKVGARGAVYVVDSMGNLVAHPDRQFALTVASLKNREIIAEILREESGNPIRIISGSYSNERGKNVFAVARALTFGWGVVAEEPEQEFFEASTSVLRLNLIVAGITSLLIFLLILSARSFLSLFRELKKERGEKAEIIANLSDGLIVTDSEGKVLLANARARDLLLLEGEITSRTIRPGDDKNTFWGLLPKIFFPTDAPNGIFKSIVPRREVAITAPAELYLALDTVMLSQEETAHRQILFVLRDMTRERVLSRLKSEFISIAAHQLRTPLSAVKWALRLILDGDLGSLKSEQREYLQSSYDTNERLIQLVNDLLNVSRIEEGRFELSFLEEDLASLTEKAVSSFKDIAAKRNVELFFQKPKGPLPAIPLDRQKIEMVLQNLIENALAYTPSGGKVQVSLEEKPEALLVNIQDTGIGIPPKERERLFTKFYRSSQATKMQPGGSGLGLFISHNIIVGHRGTIEVESEVGKGSMFQFSLPKNNRAARPYTPS